MKKSLLSLIILTSFSAFGSEYIIYPRSGSEGVLKEYLKSNYQKTPTLIFNESELKNIKLPRFISASMKMDIPATLDENFLKDDFINRNAEKIEKNAVLHFKQSKPGEFEHLQWGLKNNGRSIELKLTDIDRLNLPATPGEDINLSSLKEVTGRKIRVAVIDSGIDLLHPEFKSKIYRNELECTAWDEYKKCLALTTESEELTKACHDKWANTDTDQNGYPMDCQGWNVAAPVNAFTGVQGNNDVSDLVGHGTHISGIIAAQSDDVGITGIINNVEILPVKVSGSTEEVQEDNTTDIFAKGILYALTQGADVINLSVGWSSSEDSLLVSELIKKAHELNVLVVVAGGNSAHSTETYPCAYNEVICVGSHNPDGSRSHFSNFGSSVDIFAPGHNILSTWPLELRPKLFTSRHGYEFKNGTSFSAPFVVGVLARILNLGFTPDEARIKLLAGTRKGNLDFATSAAFKAKSFIYPFKKTTAFINWHEGDKKVILKLKNYVSAVGGVTLKLVSRNSLVKIIEDTKHFESWAKDEIKDISFVVDGDESAPSEMSFDLVINSPDENKTYSVQASATTVIHSKFSRPDTKRFAVQTSKSLEEVEFLPFQNISPAKEIDLLISQLIDGKLVVGALKLIDGSYKVSRLHSTVFDKALIIQAARIDIDLDGKIEYVLRGMYQNKDKKWVAKFYVFDENFRQSELLICPGNEQVNLLTSMGAELLWLKINNRMVPAWMALGYAPSIDLPAFNPWTLRADNAFKKRIYYLDDQGLRSLNMPSVEWSTFSPVKFFTQTLEEMKEGRARFIYTLDEGYRKSYASASTHDFISQGNFVFNQYQNLYPIEALTFMNSQDAIFSETDSTTGKGRLSVLNPESLIVEQHQYRYSDPLDPIQLVLTKTNQGSFFAHTKYHLLYLDGEATYKTESRNVSNKIQYKRLRHKEGLYLSSKHTPGLSAELVQFEDGQITRPAKYRFLTGNSCQEIGYNYSVWDEQDQILFYCDVGRSIFKVRLEKEAQ